MLELGIELELGKVYGTTAGDAVAALGGGVGVGRGAGATAGVDVLVVVGTRRTTGFGGDEDEGPAAAAAGILILIFAVEDFWYRATAKAGGRSDMSSRKAVYGADEPRAKSRDSPCVLGE